jgi:hypothetical protein
MTGTRPNATRALMCGTSLAALLSVPASAQDTSAAEAFADGRAAEGAYLSGDFHNHTTCTDGSTSVKTLVDRSILTYDLDWFAQTGHGGSGTRDCRFDDFQTGNFINPFDFEDGVFGEEIEALTGLERPTARMLWEDTVGAEGILGDETGDPRRMWRWQSLIEYAYPETAVAGRQADKTTWIGIETIAPGHEHVSMGILGDQFRTRGDAFATGQFEYLWDRADGDASGGEFYEFEDPANNGVEKNFENDGIAGHQKAVQSVEWLREHHRGDSYYVPAHVERQGGFVDDSNRGYNVEHLRNFHNAGLFDPEDVTGRSLAYGGEFAPGHQFQTNRGSYSLGRPTAGWGTYGGAGAYGAAEIALPGFTFEGEPITDEVIEGFNAEFEAEFGGNPFTSLLPLTGESNPPQRYVPGRPGLATLWDALLGEGRRYSMVFSSDWHNRGTFGPYQESSTNDAWPGEYQKIWAWSRSGDGSYSYSAARQIVRGKRDGDSWSVMGDLITELDFVMCQGAECVTMGGELEVDPAGEPVVWLVRVLDPEDDPETEEVEGANHSPYTFSNPSLLQVGLEIPLHQPVLDNIDVIRGDVYGPIPPDAPEYETVNRNPTTEIFATLFRGDMEADEAGRLVATGSIPAETFTNPMYFRLRGTNMPKGTPNETDADGNPLIDYYANNIVCPFPYVDPTPTAELDAEGNPLTDDEGQPIGFFDDEGNDLGSLFTEFNPEVCPPYLPVNQNLGEQVIDFDVEAWADLWFYSNAIFVAVDSEPVPVPEGSAGTPAPGGD